MEIYFLKSFFLNFLPSSAVKKKVNKGTRENVGARCSCPRTAYLRVLCQWELRVEKSFDKKQGFTAHPPNNTSGKKPQGARRLRQVRDETMRSKEKRKVLDKNFKSNTITSITFKKEVDIMRVTIKGQVTIPSHIREKLGITPNTDVNFLEEDGRVYLTKKKVTIPKKNKFRRFRGIATVKMTTDEIMALTRGMK